MTATEQHVRETLQRHADRAPRGSSMLDQVRRESTRRARRLRGLATTGLAAIILLGGIVAPRITDRHTVAVASPTAVHLVPGPATITVPFTVATPQGYTGPAVTLVAGSPALTFAPGSAYPGFAPIVVQEIAQPKPLGEPTLVDGQVAYVRAGDPPTDTQFVVWGGLTPSRWIEVSAPRAYPVEQVIKVVATAGSTSLPTGWRFDLVPDGFTIDNIDATTVTFCPPGVAASTGTAGKLVVTWSGGRPTVGLPPTIMISAEDLDRFTAGIHR